MALINYLKPGTPEAGSYPAIGRTYEVDYGGDLVFQMGVHSINSMTFLGIKGEFKGFTEKVEISVTPIRPGVFIVAWQETNQTTVIHIEDFENGIIYAYITFPGNIFVCVQGPFKLIK